MSKPTNVETTDINKQTIRVTWDDGNGSVDKFIVNCTCNKDDEDNYQCDSYSEDGDGRTHTCTDLTPGSAYDVSVTAVKGEDQNTSESTEAVTSK